MSIEELRRLDAQKQKEGLTRSELVRKMIALYLRFKGEGSPE
jgi:hypothetical protein